MSFVSSCEYFFVVGNQVTAFECVYETPVFSDLACHAQYLLLELFFIAIMVSSRF